jgi:hypothetical protein
MFPHDQVDLRFLYVPESCGQDIVIEDHTFSRSGSSSSVKASRSDLQLAAGAPDTHRIDLQLRENSDLETTCSVHMHQKTYVTVNYISPEACAFLAVAEAAAVLRAEAVDAENVATEHSSLAGLHDPERVLLCFSPPKRFYRAFWQSASLQLLHRWTQTARPCKSDAQNRQASMA